MKSFRWVVPLLLLMPGILFAQDPSGNPLSLAPPPTDVSVKFLASIFGLVDGMLYGTGSQIMGKMFGVFNAAVLAIGGIVLMYTLLISTLNTAQEGEMLGKKWSSAWVPIRSVAAVALLLPKASGYCVMQIFVMWIVLQGIGAADRIWEAALNYLATGGVLISSVTGGAAAQVGPAGVSSKTQDAKNLLNSLICMHTLQHILDDAHDLASNNTELPDPGRAPNLIGSVDLRTRCTGTGKCILPMPYLADETGIYSSLHGACGSFMVNPLDAGQVQQLISNISASSGASGGGLGAALGQAAQGVIGDTTNCFFDWGQLGLSSNCGGTGTGSGIDAGVRASINELANARVTAAQQMYIELEPTANQIVSNYFDDTQDEGELPLGQLQNSNDPTSPWVANTGYGTLTPLLTGYEIDNTVNAYYALTLASLRALSGQARVLDYMPQAKRDGWIVAGSHFLNLISAENANRAMTTPNDQNSMGILGAFSVENDTSTNQISFSYTVKDGSSTKSLPGEFPSDTTYQAVFDFSDLIKVQDNAKEADGMINRYITDAMTIAQRNTRAEGERPPMISAGISFNIGDISKFQDCIGGDIMGWCAIKDTANVIIEYVINGMILPIVNTFLDGIELIIEPLGDTLRGFFNAIFRSLESTQHPVISLSSFGNTFIDVAGSAWVAGTIVALSTVASPVSPTATAALTWIGPVLNATLFTMLAYGLTLSFYIPLIPYIIFLMGALGWIVGVIEAMVAAPIVALGLAHPEGQNERFGRAEPAINMLLNVFLRPSMMIIGFIGAILLSYVAIYFLNYTFGNIINALLENLENWASLFGPLFAIGLYLMIFVMLMQKSFDLIHMLPDKVLSWIGSTGAPGASSEFARGAGAEGEREFGKMAGSAKETAGAMTTASKQSQSTPQTGDSTPSAKEGGGDDSGGGSGEAEVSAGPGGSGSDSGSSSGSGSGSGSSGSSSSDGGGPQIGAHRGGGAGGGDSSGSSSSSSSSESSDSSSDDDSENR